MQGRDVRSNRMATKTKSGCRSSTPSCRPSNVRS